MSTLDFNHAQAQQMQTVQRVITAALLPFKAQTEAALVVFALVRCAKILLGLYPDKFRAQLVALLCDYLEHKETPPGEKSPLWMPDKVN